ncbi:MAG: HBL/NHE enterotoxin family protein [Crocosphaera sp.]|nr:HBL/NHE enterotoxin family protein [Crocosphaera sp.]
MSNLRLLNNSLRATDSGIQKLGKAAQMSASSGLIIQGYALQVLQQPTFIIPETELLMDFPDIKGNLMLAKGNASSYLNSIQPKIIGVLSQVRGFSNQFKGFQPLIIQRLNDWSEGSDQARNDVLTLVGQLKNDTDRRMADAKTVANELDTFRVGLNEDISNFQTSISRATTLIQGTEGDEGVLASFRNQISNLDGQINGAIAGIAISSIGVIGGTILIFIGGTFSILSGGLTIPLVKVGVGFVVAGVAGLTAASIVLSNLQRAKSALLVQEQQLKDNVKFLEDLKLSLNPLNEQARQAATEVNNMFNSWNFLGENLGEVQTSLQNASDFDEVPIVVQAYLNSAYDQWNQVGVTINTIERQMTGVMVENPTDADGNPLPLVDIINRFAQAA